MINRFTLAVILLLLTVILAGCADTASPVRLTWDEAAEIISDGAIVLDVRSLNEFNTGHIPGAVSLPIDEIAEAVRHMIPDKEQIVLVYCRSGARSATAAAILADMGYQNVFDLGGILDRENGEFE